MLQRTFTTCLVRPEDVPPSRDDLKVVGTFNPAAVDMGNGDVMLLVRVVEAPVEERPGEVGLPRYDPQGDMIIDWVRADEYVLDDPRNAFHRKTGICRLRFVSRIRAMVVKHGRSMESFHAQGPDFIPLTEDEVYGVEDPRTTTIEDRVYMTYVAVSQHGISTALASTTDFQEYERHGVILPPENKDVLLFPERIGGQFMLLHRPHPNCLFSTPEIWLARSSNLTEWGHHQPLMRGEGEGEVGRIGGSTPPIRTEHGWLMIYHGNDKERGESGIGRYTASAVLLDLQDPARIIARTPGPILTPDEQFEKNGFVGDVIFPTGIVERGEEYYIYYGAADAYCGVLGIRRDDLFHALEEV